MTSDFLLTKNMAILTEQVHQECLDDLLKLVKEIKEAGIEESLPKYIPLIKDNLAIAADVGYLRLADEYTALFQQHGLYII